MKARHSSPISALLLIGFASPALAQPPCDCTTIVDSCSAEVAVRDDTIEVTSDRPQCSRVDYFIDGRPFVSLVVDGIAREDRAFASAEPRVLVQSCQVCRDNRPPDSISAAPSPAPQPANGPLEPLIQVQPQYPPGAAALGIGGYVEVEITVGPEGVVENAAIVASEPFETFDEAVLRAVTRWRYPAEPGRPPITLTQTIEFRPSLDRAPPPPAVEPRAERAAALGPRNACVRESSRFNYGEYVEIGLINACDTPIMVFACAEGFGRWAGQWTCTTSEQQRNLLVGPGDPRAGETMTIADEDGEKVMVVALTERFFLSRAPNTEYWWLACRSTDAECRGAARQWTRSLEGQLAAADPRGRSSATLARSY
ncbi:MAG TPA: energy transducer TonB [Gammaproteobacteria bacterium]